MGGQLQRKNTKDVSEARKSYTQVLKIDPNYKHAEQVSNWLENHPKHESPTKGANKDTSSCLAYEKSRQERTLQLQQQQQDQNQNQNQNQKRKALLVQGLVGGGSVVGGGSQNQS